MNISAHRSPCFISSKSDGRDGIDGSDESDGSDKSDRSDRDIDCQIVKFELHMRSSL